MAASNTDKVRKASSGSGRPVVTTLALAKTAGSDTAEITSATNWNTSTGVDVMMYRRQLDSGTGKYVEVDGTRTTWVGVLTGTTLSNLDLRAGTEPASGYAADGNTVVQCGPTAASADDFADTFLTQHGQDGTHKVVTATSVDAPIISQRGVNLETIRSETSSNFVASGGVIAKTSGLTASFSDIVYYIAGRRYTKSSVANRDYTASKDTYVDIDTSGNLTYVEVSNGATTGMTLTANSLRVAKVVTDGSGINSVTQSGNGPLTVPLRPTGAISAANINFASITLAYTPPLGSTFINGTTTYTDTGLTLTVTIPPGVTMIEARIVNGTGNANVASGSYADFQIIDESSNQVAYTQIRNVTGTTAAVDPLALSGWSAVTAGSTKTFKVQSRINGSGSSAQLYTGARLVITAVG